ncbi:hypothetical protein [Maridesulfovibrio sp.]|uniref:hypothetical protein n=1 Tax=Maridesulfovibrio sp. TaxID=2795000 RepID=UPI0029C9E232|nr:hypothetical protein [Maridesulfovibrio sp.]
MKLFIIFLVGILLGSIISYFAVTHVIALRGGTGMFGLMGLIKEAQQDEDIVDLMTCAALAKSLGYKVDHLKLNFLLNKKLKKLDDGTSWAFNALVFIKGYGVGKADQIADKDKEQAFERLNCQQRFPGVVEVVK